MSFLVSFCSLKRKLLMDFNSYWIKLKDNASKKRLIQRKLKLFIILLCRQRQSTADCNSWVTIISIRVYHLYYIILFLATTVVFEFGNIIMLLHHFFILRSCFYILKIFFKKIKKQFQIKIFLMFLYYFDMLC